jgi:dipeptidyl aminopeptidase/acylaminoacyl peptidase
LERYAVAQEFLCAASQVRNGAVYPHWIDGNHFWYERSTHGCQYVVIDARTGMVRLCIAHAEIVQQLPSAALADIAADDVLISDIAFDLDRATILFRALGDTYSYSLERRILAPALPVHGAGLLVSPDRRLAIFARGHNLWVRELASGSERALTSDGTPFQAYGDTPHTRRFFRNKVLMTRPEGLWSPDSKRFLTLRVDDSHVLDCPIMDFAPEDALRPRIIENRMAFPGDREVPCYRMITIDIESGQAVDAHYPELAATRMYDTPFSARLAWWKADSRLALFVDIERGEKVVHVVAFDTDTGETRPILTESSTTSIDLGPNVYSPATATYIAASDELVWYSEQTGNGHLYLYDATTGICKNQITSGDWRVRDVLHADPEAREIFLTASGLSDDNPYRAIPARVSLDGGEVQILSELAGNHVVWRPGEHELGLLGLRGQDPNEVSGFAPSGDYFVETVGAIDRLPITVLRARDGSRIATLEDARDNALPRGWSWPEAVTLTAADGTTAIFGLLFRPIDYDPGRSYPLIDFVYGGPQLSHVPQSAFGGGMAGDYRFAEAAHLSALGAYVLMVDGRGTAEREQAFRVLSYGAIHTASNLDDHIAAIRQLALQRPQIDLNRIGVCGFSAGGYLAALAALRHGDFFKVAVAAAGNYDQRLMWHCWGERYHGLVDEVDYAPQAARDYVDGFAGKLLLIHGLLDSGNHPAHLFQLVEALNAHNKDYDLVILPRAGHEMPGYALRRQLDFFVEHLFNSQPPRGTLIDAPTDRLFKRLNDNARAAAPSSPRR